MFGIFLKKKPFGFELSIKLRTFKQYIIDLGYIIHLDDFAVL